MQVFLIPMCHSMGHLSNRVGMYKMGTRLQDIMSESNFMGTTDHPIMERLMPPSDGWHFMGNLSIYLSFEATKKLKLGELGSYQLLQVHLLHATTPWVSLLAQGPAHQLISLDTKMKCQSINSKNIC